MFPWIASSSSLLISALPKALVVVKPQVSCESACTSTSERGGSACRQRDVETAAHVGGRQDASKGVLKAKKAIKDPRKNASSDETPDAREAVFHRSPRRNALSEYACCEK